MVYLLNIVMFFFISNSAFTNNFISIKEITDKANLRKGPGNWYPIKWIIETPSLPLKVLEAGEKFNKVELHDGTRGWLSVILTSNVKNLIVIKDALLKDKSGNLKAKILKDYIIKEFDCSIENKLDFCKVTAENIKGYIKKTHLWGH